MKKYENFEKTRDFSDYFPNFNKKQHKSTKFAKDKSFSNKDLSAYNFEDDEKINYKKSLGQNFIYDKNLLHAIALDGDVSSEDTVLEIGAGAGTLTETLSALAKKVISFEIDESLRPRLEELNKTHPNIEFHFQDFMSADLDELCLKNARVIANIPYYITTPIIFKLVEKKENFKSILVLVQKEVAERIAGQSGTKDYGITSVILQSIFDVSITRVVRKECFTPSPKVDSALLKLVPHNKYRIDNFDTFRDFIHKSFAMRRKTIVNNLKSYFDKDKLVSILNTLGYDENIRPEKISVENFIEMYSMLNN